MNLFLPAGLAFEGGNAFVSNLMPAVRSAASINVDRWLFPGSGSFAERAINDGSVIYNGPIHGFGFDIPRTPRVGFKAFFGVSTNIRYGLYGGLYGYDLNATNEYRIAVASGSLTVALYGENNKLLGLAESTFDVNSLSTDIVFENFALDYAGSNSLRLEYEYKSDAKLPFGPIDIPRSKVSLPGVVRLVEPNQSLVAKTTLQGASIVSYGPQAIAVSSCTLTETEILNLRANSFFTATHYANAEIDEELNCRASISASASSFANLLGPVVLQATTSGVASSSANASLQMSMAASAVGECSLRAVPYIGTTQFLAANAIASAVQNPNLTMLVSSRVSGMTIYVNLETREFVVSPVLIAPVTTMKFTRRDIEAIDVKFVRNGQVVQLSYGSTGKLGIKSEFDGSALALDTSWQERGNGNNAVYQFSLNLNTEELNDLFVTDEEESVVAKFELEWTEGGTINTTLPCTALILNDVLRGDEGAPTPASVTEYFDLRSDDDSVWRISVDNDGLLTAIKQ
jgi:hypothetical protein